MSSVKPAIYNLMVYKFWRIPSNFRLLNTHLGGALYIPDQGRHLIQLLESSGSRAFVDELNRLSKLGAFWAAAVLGYRCLLMDSEGKRDPKRAIDLCSEGAAAGDGYSRFVLAWAHLLDGRSNLGVKYMRRAAVGGFLPAKMDYSTFVWNGWGMKEVYAAAAMRLVQLSIRDGHKAALIWKCKMYCSGRFGSPRQLLGYIVMPLARLAYVIALLRDPFSRYVFVFQPHARRLNLSPPVS